MNMKFFHSILAVLGILCSISFVSCGDDDDEPFEKPIEKPSDKNSDGTGNSNEKEDNNSSQSLSSSFFVGTWYPAGVMTEYEILREQGFDAEELIAQSDKIVFDSNGTGNYRWNITFSGNHTSSGNSNFTWTTKRNEIVILWDGDRTSKNYGVIVFNATGQVVFTYDNGNSVNRFADNTTGWEKQH
ncbi:MAG: lipocalin family protein [Bacteroidaceae bacterium]|nr:lipocalin family protein [Bacteroidaceae bacterium]